MHVRVIELPACLMATTGPSPDADPFADDGLLTRFDAWFTARTEPLPLAPRDLMWFDDDAEALAWGYLLGPDDDGSPWDVVPFPGGLYAAAVCRDLDDQDGERVLADLRDWVDASPLDADESAARPVLFRITTPQAVADLLGHHQMELLVPCRLPAALIDA